MIELDGRIPLVKAVSMCLLLLLSGYLIAQEAGEDPFADKGGEKAKAKPQATEANASFKKYRDAVMQVQSMHEKKPFPSMEKVVEEFLKIVGRKWDDLKPSSGGSKSGEWDTIYQIQIGDEVFSLQMSGPVEQEKDGLRRSIQKCDRIEFNVGQLDSSFAYENLWTWQAKPVPAPGKSPRGVKGGYLNKRASLNWPARQAQTRCPNPRRTAADAAARFSRSRPISPRAIACPARTPWRVRRCS